MALNPFSLLDKHILVIGASSGIGRATAITCSQLGARISIIARNSKNLERTFNSLCDGNNKSYVCDILDEKSLSKTISGLDKVDGIVFCAGVIKTIPATLISREDIDFVFNTNYHATVNACTLLLQHKKINKNASIVFVSSIAAQNVAWYGNAIYGSSKAAISAYAKVLALELSKRFIRVNCILPGMIKTSFYENASLGQLELDEDEKKYPLGYGTPEDVANACAYFLSPASKWVTGSQFILDGGLTLQ